MILRFTIDHLRASRVAGTWVLARRLPGDIGRSAGDAVVRQVRSRGCPLIGLDRKWLAKGQNGAFDPNRTSISTRKRDMLRSRWESNRTGESRNGGTKKCSEV